MIVPIITYIVAGRGIVLQENDPMAPYTILILQKLQYPAPTLTPKNVIYANTMSTQMLVTDVVKKRIPMTPPAPAPLKVWTVTCGHLFVPKL